MYNDHQILIYNINNVYTVKTDAFTIHADNLKIAEPLLKFDGGIGSWRLSKADGMANPKVELMERNILEVKLPTNQLTKLYIKYEYDREGICKLLEEHKQLMIKANTSGCSTSYMCEGMDDLGYNVLFICPTNKLIQNTKRLMIKLQVLQ
jgi:hypothetical protein